MVAVYLCHLVACAVLSVPLAWLLVKRWHRWNWFRRTVAIEGLAVLWLGPVLLVSGSGAYIGPGMGTLVHGLLWGVGRETGKHIIWTTLMLAIEFLFLYLPVSFAYRISSIFGRSWKDPQAGSAESSG